MTWGKRCSAARQAWRAARTVGLRSSNHLDQPAILENYLQCDADVKVQIEAIKLCRELTRTKAFAELAPAEALPGPGKSEQELDYMRIAARLVERTEWRTAVQDGRTWRPSRF